MSPDCPAGTIVTGGGASTEYATSLPGPVPDVTIPQGTHWFAQIEPPVAGTFTDDGSITVYAICVSVG